MVIEQSFITVTDKAAERAKAILTKGGIADAALRVFVASGGCSGYQFGMTIARNREAGDIEIVPLYCLHRRHGSSHRVAISTSLTKSAS